MRQLIAALILITAFVSGCASPAVDVAEDDPLIATQEPTSESTAVLTSTATETPSATETQAATSESTLDPEIAELATQLASITPLPTPASDLYSEGTIWEFGDGGYAYVYEGNLCLNTTGTPVLLGEAADRVTLTKPSPNGLYIAYQRLFLEDPDQDTYRSEVRIARTDGSQNIIAWTSEKLQEMYPAAGGHFVNLQWMASSTQLLFSSAQTVFGLSIPNADLYRYDATTPELIGMLPRLRLDDYNTHKFLQSPDGNWIALWDGNSLGFMRSDGAVYREDVFTFQWEPQPCEAVEPALNPVWAADSSGVSFVVKGWVPPDPAIDLSLAPLGDVSSWFVPVSGEPQKLGEFSGDLLPTKTCSSWEGVALSPNLRWIAYAFPYPNYAVGLIRTDGTEQISLLDETSEAHGRSTQLTWLDDRTFRFALDANAPFQWEEGRREVSQTRYFTGSVDGTVTPADGPPLPANPLISCNP